MPLNPFDQFVWHLSTNIVRFISSPIGFFITVACALYYFFCPIETLYDIFYHIIIEIILRFTNALLIYRVVRTIILEREL